MAQLANTDYMKEDDVFPSVAAWEERVMAMVKEGGLYGISETRLMEDYHLVLCANWDNDDIECEAGSSAIWENGNLVVAGFTMPHNDRCIAHQRAALRNQDLQFDNQVQVQQSPSPPYQAFPSQSTTIQPTARTLSPQSVDPPAEIHQDSQAHHQQEESASSPPHPPIAPQASAVEPIPAQNAIANSDMEMSVDEVIREPSITQQEAQQPIDFRETSTHGPENPHRLLLQYAARSSPSKLRRLSKTSSTEGVLSWLQQQSTFERENAHGAEGSHDHLPDVAASHKQSTIGESSSSGRQELCNAQNDIQPPAGVDNPETSQVQRQATPHDKAAEDTIMASVDSGVHGTTTTPFGEEAVTASSESIAEQQEQQRLQAGPPEASKPSEPRDNLLKLVNVAIEGLFTQDDSDRLKDFIEQQGGSTVLGVPPLQSNTLAGRVGYVNTDMQVDDVVAAVTPSQHAVLPSDRDEQASPRQAEDKQADAFASSENPLEVTGTTAASRELSASTHLQQSSDTSTPAMTVEPQKPTGSTNPAQELVDESSPETGKAAPDDMVTDEAQATSLHASQDIPAPPSATSTASAPIRSTSPPKDSAVSSGKYYFSMAALKESMKTWHATRFPGRAEHAGMSLQRSGPFEAPYVICKARHEGHVDDCPMSVAFAIMPDRQSYKVTTSITEHSAACDNFASGPAPEPKPAQPAVTAHVQPASTTEPLASARSAINIEAEAATSTSTSTTAPPKKASKPKSQTATPEALATTKRDTPGNIVSKIVKDLQISGQAGQKTSSNPFGFSFRKIVDVHPEGLQFSKSSAKGPNSLKSTTKTPDSIYEVPATIIKQSSSGLANGVISKNVTFANDMKAATATIKPSSTASKASGSNAKAVGSGSTQSNASARPRGRPKGSTKAAMAANATAGSTSIATATAPSSITTVKTSLATTEKPRNKPDSTSNINSTTLPSVKGKVHDYAKPLTEKDKLDPDYFRVGRQFESYESFDKCLAAWHEKAFPGDSKKRYIARRENRNGKPRVTCSLREKVMTFKCPFLIKLHPLPGDNGFEVFQSDTRHSDGCNKRLERDHQELLKKQASTSEESSDEESGEYSQAGTTSSKRNARRSVNASSRTAKRKLKSGLKRKSDLVKSDRFASSSSDLDESSANESETESESDSDSGRNLTDLAEYSGTRSWRKANKSEDSQNMKNNKKKKTMATKGDESMNSSEDSTASAADPTSGAGSDSEKESPASDIEMADSKIEHSLIAIQAESSSSSESDSDSSGDETSSMSGASGDLPEKTTRTAEKHVEADATLEDVKVPKRNSDTATGAVTSADSMQVDAVDGLKRAKEEPGATTTSQEHEAAAEDDNFKSIDDDEAARLKAARQVTFREQGFEDLLCDRLELHHIRNFQDMIDAGLREMDFEELIIFVFQEEPFAKDNKRFITKVELHFAKKHLQCMMAVEADLLSGEEQKA